MVCFDHVAQQTMKNRLFSCYLSANQIFVIFLIYCYFAQRTAAAIKEEERDVKWKIRKLEAAKGCNF